MSVKKKTLIILVGISVLGIVFLRFSNELSQSDHVEQVTQDIADKRKKEKVNASSGFNPTAIGVSVTDSKQPDQKFENDVGDQNESVFHESKRMRDSDYMKMLNRHFELKAYLNSEARDTLEFAEIEGLLKQFGYDQQYMRIAYNAAYEWRIEQTMDNQLRLATVGDKAHKFEKVRGSAEENLMKFKRNIVVKKMMFQGITNASLIELILDVKPTKFFGQREIFANEGEELILSVD